MAIPSLAEIKAAAERIRPHIHRTPVLSSSAIDKICGAHLLFKCENFQKAGAFKSRGACNAVFSLDESQLEKGVCTHSSGNHAQALARAASLRNTHAFIVMPETSPTVKVSGVKGYGGSITFCKPTLAAREETLALIVEKHGALEIHPYNNYRIIAGQATAAMELLEDTGRPDIVMAPVGGGGLLSGTALATKYISPGTKVIAAEPEMANDAYRSFHEGRFVPSENPKTIADGLLTSLGTLTYPIIQEYVDDIVTCSEEYIIKAMRLIWERMKIVIEPSSAVPLAAILEGKLDVKGKTVGIILSGGNVDMDRLPWMPGK
ncbi:MAG TPA: pyridoxal-phosphate dependent enzyme [Bacteroidales bacterium]|nr:pyridoxal-phosphate dependent enzyme [Bacteroidales bacterium]